MNVIPPLAILPSMITSGLPAEPRSAPANYAAGTSYAFGDLVTDPASDSVYISKRASNAGNTPSASPNWWAPAGFAEPAYSPTATYAALATVSFNHRVYQSQAAGNTGHQPDISPANWTDVGATNAWAMFDQLGNRATFAVSPLTIVLTAGARVDAIALTGLQCDTVRTQVSNGGVSVYDETISLSKRAGPITGWYEYFFTGFTQQDSLARFDLPPFSGSVVTLTFTRGAGLIAVGSIDIGKKVYIGIAQFAPTDDAENYSTIDRDAYGDAILIPRRSIPDLSLTVVSPRSMVPSLRTLRDTLNAVPAIWCAFDDDADGYFPSGLVRGVYKKFQISLAYPQNAVTSLELEGL